MTKAEEPVGEILGLFVGRPQVLWTGKPPSAINKSTASGRLDIDERGFVLDQQADLEVHGGPEKAIHHYANDHMPFWQEQFPERADTFRPGCFGENISTTGLTEHNVCLGDLLTLGSAKVQVSQGRQPCWKLSAHTGIEMMAAQFRLTAKTGWYYRVLETGAAGAGDRMQLVERTHPEWTIHRLTTAHFNARLDAETAQELAGLKALSESWRAAFAKKAGP